MKKVFKILIIGLLILVGAILLNIVSHYLDISNWYDFYYNNFKASVADIVWLFIIYPFGLGLIGYLTSHLILGK